MTSSGRGTFSLNVNGVGTGNFAFYVVNSSQLLIVQIDPISQGLQTLFTGQIVQQQGLTYSNSDLNGVSVLGLQGVDTAATRLRVRKRNWISSCGTVPARSRTAATITTEARRVPIAARERTAWVPMDACPSAELAIKLPSST